MSIKKNPEKYHKKRDFSLTAEPFGGDKETPDEERTGSCTFALNRKKLQGGYTLFRFKKGKKPMLKT